MRKKTNPKGIAFPKFPVMPPRVSRVLRCLGFSLLLILAGGILFNLDRIGNAPVFLLKYKEYLPASLVKFLPGGGAKYTMASPAEHLEGLVVDVHDGDTITLWKKENNRKYRIRFYGIDAPELAQKGGVESRETLKMLILGKTVQIDVVNLDRYGRIVGRVWMEGASVNRFMVYSGEAWYYAQYAPKEYDLSAAQEDARSRKAGLWRDPAPQPPWEYRRTKRK